MRALVVQEPHRFSVEDVPEPRPGPFELLCKVKAIAICGTDPHIIAGDYPGFWPKEFPFIPGHEWVGEVVELGQRAAELGWERGTRVAGTSHAGCGFCRLCIEGRYNLCENFGDERLHRQYGHYTQGAYADYVVHSVKSVFAVPDELSDDEAAMLDPTSIALHTVKLGGHAPGDTVTVVGPGVMGLLVAECAARSGRGVCSWSAAARGLRRPPSSAMRRWTSPRRIRSRVCASAPAAVGRMWRSSAPATRPRWEAVLRWSARVVEWP
jgi:L-iditol 2-dehydrogenase